MKSYHFDVGNSNDGPIGLCASITADSKEEALTRLQLVLEFHCDGLPVDLRYALPDRGLDDYVNVYFNGDNVTVDDIDEEEEVSS